jgi:hypothetical protein
MHHFALDKSSRNNLEVNSLSVSLIPSLFFDGCAANSFVIYFLLMDSYKYDGLSVDC